MQSHRTSLALLFFVFTTLPVGCANEPTATISGTVQIDGQPLPAGMVLFEGQGHVGAADIRDGNYQLPAKIPPGRYAVSILPPPVETVIDPITTEMRAATTVDERLYPERYRVASTSDLQFTAQDGENVHNITLTTQATTAASP